MTKPKLTGKTKNKSRMTPIDAINISPAVQIRTRLNQEAIDTYVDILDQLPPIDLFEVKKHGLVLADGFHRVEAAKRANRDRIKANVAVGTLNDAMEWAVVANLKHGQPLRGQERQNAILRMVRLHPGWRQAQVAKVMGVSSSFISNITDASEVRKEVQGKVHIKRTTDLLTVHRLPKDLWAPVLSAANVRGWNSEEMRIALKNLKDDRVPEEFKTALIEGKADPIIVTKNGEPAMLPKTVARLVAKEVKSDANVILLKAEEALARLASVPLREIVEAVDSEHTNRLLGEFPRYIATLETILSEIKSPRTLRQVQ